MHVCCPLCSHTAVAPILEPGQIVAAGYAQVRELRAYICINGHIFFLRRSDLTGVRSTVRLARPRKVRAPHRRRVTNQ
jgi:hypothetical protein